MPITALLLVCGMTTSMLSIDTMKYFPGDYYESVVRDRLESRVMASWPGPTRLLEIWNTAELSEEQRVALLVGGAAFHDPLLLPAYREAVESEAPRLRQAAVYGYRRLLFDGRPNISGGVDLTAARALAEEMDFLAEVLRRRPLIEVWLQSILAHEGLEMPGWGQVKFNRSKAMCLRAVEQAADVRDLGLLVEAYELSADTHTRISLLRLIEGLSLSRFIVQLSGIRKAWGPHVFEDAQASFEHSLQSWRGEGCAVEGEAVLRRNITMMGLTGVDPLAPEGCEIWLKVLRGGTARWVMLASRQLYSCGGPWVEFSSLKDEDKESKDQRSRLLAWFGPAPQPNSE